MFGEIYEIHYVLFSWGCGRTTFYSFRSHSWSGGTIPTLTRRYFPTGKLNAPTCATLSRRARWRFAVTPRKHVCLNLFGGIWMRMVIISLDCLAFRLCIQGGVFDNFMPFLFPSWPCLQVHGGFMPVSCLIVAFGGLGGLAVPLARGVGRSTRTVFQMLVWQRVRRSRGVLGVGFTARPASKFA